LGTVVSLRGRTDCCTIDSFAWRLYRRWRGLAAHLGVMPRTEVEFDAVCDLAGVLLEQAVVREWIIASFPVVLVDEAQDLKPERLRIIRALAQTVHLLVAADEFQCLDPALRPNPLVLWLQQAAEPEKLDQVHRTNSAGLLAAATAIRASRSPVNGNGFRILRPGVSVPLAATLVANAIAWRQGGDVAIISPSLKGGFAQSVVARVAQGPCGKHQTGPYTIKWEGNDTDEAQAIIADLKLNAEVPAFDACAAIRALPEKAPTRATLIWIENQIHACGRTKFTRAEIEEVIARQVSLGRQHGSVISHLFKAMTVQQAKNREFDGVVVLWPYQVGGDDEHKRRLLYNAVTRAKRWCNIIVQHQNILNGAPFN
jgi:hypothetical protein